MGDERTPCRFSVLGPLRIERGHEVVVVRSRRHRAVLALLLVHAGEAVSADRLAEAAWPQDQPGSPRGALQSVVSRLRARLGAGPSIVATPTGYRLDADVHEIDAQRFDGLVEQARSRPPDEAADLLAAALEMWRGPAFADLTHLDGVRAEATRLDERRAAATEQLTAHRLTLGDYHGALETIAPLMGDDHLRERACELQMLALHHAGRTADALSAFREFRVALADGLGLDPSPRLLELERRILAQDLPAPTVTTERRPASPSSEQVADAQRPASSPRRPAAPPAVVGIRGEADRFIGRQTLLERLSALVTQPEVRLVTLTGPGGVGKTRVARHTARAVTDRFPGGVFLVELASVRSAAAVPTAVADALGLSDVAAVTTAEQVARLLSQGPSLLVLDNFEHVIDAAVLVSDLLARTPDLTVLVTSREVLRLSGEHVLAVPPMPLPGGSEGPQALLDVDSVALFVDRARAGGRSLAPSAEDLETVADIVRRVDGLPLAIELAAAQCRLFSPAHLLDRLGSGLAALGTGPRDAPQRHRTLRDTIQWSYELLPTAQRDLFERLGLFVGGFGIDSVEALTADPSAALDVLAGLCDRSLVRTAGSAGGVPRFEMLETVREFARERLEERPDADDLKDRHARHFLRLAEELEPDYYRHQERRIVDRSAADDANFGAAADWLLAHGDSASAVRIGVVFFRAWWVRSRFREGMARMRTVLACDAELSPHDRAHALFIEGYLSFGLSEMDAAIPCLTEALEGYEAVGDERGMAQVLVPLGALTSALDLPEGTAMLERAVMLAESADAWTVAFAELGYGSVLVAAGRNADAVAHLERSITHSRRLGTEVLLAYTLTYLARALIGLGRLGEARAALAEALERGGRLRSGDVVARTLVDVAAVEAEQTSFERAAEVLGAAAAVRAAIGTPVYLPDRQHVSALTQRVEEALGQVRFAEAFGDGRALTLEQATRLTPG